MAREERSGVQSRAEQMRGREPRGLVGWSRVGNAEIGKDNGLMHSRVCLGAGRRNLIESCIDFNLLVFLPSKISSMISVVHALQQRSVIGQSVSGLG